MFAVGNIALNGFRMIERHYFRDRVSARAACLLTRNRVDLLPHAIAVDQELRLFVWLLHPGLDKQLGLRVQPAAAQRRPRYVRHRPRAHTRARAHLQLIPCQ